MSARLAALDRDGESRRSFVAAGVGRRTDDLRTTKLETATGAWFAAHRHRAVAGVPSLDREADPCRACSARSDEDLGDRSGQGGRSQIEDQPVDRQAPSERVY